MDRQHIGRTDLKRNFLNEVIMRLDFQGVFQAEMESVLIKAKLFLKQKGFDRYIEKVNNQIINNDGTIQDVKSQIVYSFSSENSGYKLDLSTTCVVLSVKTQGYSSFEEYSEIFRHLIDIYRDKIAFFTCKRFGLRKINFCFVNEIGAVNKYFSNKYYSCHVPDVSFEPQNIERKDHLTCGNKKLNLIYAVEQGKLGDKDAYKVTLDTDIYLIEQTEIEKMLSDQQGLLAINDIAFKIYLASITDNMIELLRNGKIAIDNCIMGIEDNE